MTDTENSLLRVRNVGIHGTPGFGVLLTAGIDNITDAPNFTTPFDSGLRSIGIVLEGGIKGELCVEDRFLSGSGRTAAFGNELVLGSGMIDLC